MEKQNGNALVVYLVFIAIALLSAAGWVTNVIWTFKQDGWSVLLGILGALVAPIGAIHGIYLWF